MAGAVQMDARMGDVAGNLARAERLAREAFAKGAEWVMLPEMGWGGKSDPGEE